MTGSANLLHASLDRAGGGPARLMAAFGRIDDRFAALDIDLDAHPLCRAGAWQALLPPLADPPRLDAILAQLGRPVAGEPPAAASNPLAQTASPPPRRPGALLQPGPTAATGRAASAPDPAPLAGSTTLADAQASARPVAARPPKIGIAADWPKSHPSGLAGTSDPVLAAAADRPVRTAPLDAVRQRVADLLSGDGTGRAAGLLAAEPVLPPTLRQISRVLDRIAVMPARRGAPAPDRRIEGFAGSIAAAAATDVAPVQLITSATNTGTGLERLLARGRSQHLTSAGPGAGVEARLANGQPAPVTPDAAAARGPDLVRSDRLPQRPGAWPGAGPEAALTAGGSEAFARALTDLLRREARAAGIDLRGDP